MLPFLKKANNKSLAIHQDIPFQIELFQEMSKRVPAYRRFLAAHKVDPRKVRTLAEFSNLPVMTKDNYFRPNESKFADLMWNGKLDMAISYVATSGSTGNPFTFAVSKAAVADGEATMEAILVEMGIATKRTLILNCFTMGLWMAGTAVDTWGKSLAQKWPKLSVVSPGFNQLEALRVLDKLWSTGEFDQVVMFAYPQLALNLILAAQKGLKDSSTKKEIVRPQDIKSMNIHTVHGGAAFNEAWRDKLLKALGADLKDPKAFKRVINMYAASEIGLIGFETGATIALRRTIADDLANERGGALGGLLADNNRQPSIQQIDPAIRYVENYLDDKGISRVLISADNAMPLLRYNSGDEGCVIPIQEAATQIADSMRQWKIKEPIREWPLVAVHGRGGASIYGATIPREYIAAAAEDERLHEKLTGLFIVDPNDGDALRLTFQLAPGVRLTVTQQKKVNDIISEELQRISTEYRELTRLMGESVYPQCIFLTYDDSLFSAGSKPVIRRK